MGWLRIAFAAVSATAFSVPSAVAEAETVADWRPYIAEASQRFGIPVRWIERVIQAESGGRIRLNGRPITSPAGAMGLMQLMPGTWVAMRAQHGLGPDPHHPRDNILAGTAYLRAMYDRFGYPGLFGAYNAGPARYAAALAGRSRLPEETRAYLATVAGAAIAPRRLPSVVVQPPLIFVTRSLPSPQPAKSSRPVHSLFVALSNR